MTKEYDEAIAQLHSDVNANNLTNASAISLALTVAKLEESERILFTEYLWNLNEQELEKLKQNEENRNNTGFES